jgi:hypothetical protein
MVGTVLGVRRIRRGYIKLRLISILSITGLVLAQISLLLRIFGVF